MPAARPAANAFLAAILIVLVVAPVRAAATDPARAHPTTWDTTLIRPGEPGDPFEMSGIVRSENGMPLQGVRVWIYHADSHGRYGLSDKVPFRLSAVLRTDANGRYRIRSVFPGTYGYAAHVHFGILDAPGGGGFVNVRQEGHQAPQAELSVTVKQDKDGVWRLQRDLYAKSSMNNVVVPALRPPDLHYPSKPKVVR